MLGPSSWSAKRMARVGAILSPLSGVPDGFSTYMLTRVFVRNNPAATAAKLLGAETMFRLGMVSELFALAMFVASAILLYAVFKPADRHVALLFLVTTTMGATMQALNVVADGAALTFLKGGTGIAGLTVEQTQAIVTAALRMHSFTYTVALVFIGISALWLAWLAQRSTFLPKILGYLVVIDGLGYVIWSCSALALPVLAARLQPFLPYGTALIGEFPLWIWLMIKGVDESRWRQQSTVSQAVGADLSQ